MAVRLAGATAPSPAPATPAALFAENDMENASSLARQIVGRWGCRRPSGRSRCFPRLARNRPMGLDAVAPATKALGETEARKIIEEC